MKRPWTLGLLLFLALTSCSSTRAPDVPTAPSTPAIAPGIATPVPAKATQPALSPPYPPPPTVPTPTPVFIPHPLTITPLTRVGGNITGVAMSGTLLFSSDTSGSLTIYSRQDPAHPRQLSRLATTARPVQLNGDILYALSEDGLQIIDVHDPARPSLRGNLGLTPGPTRLSVAGTRAWITLVPPPSPPGFPGTGTRIVAVDVSDLDHPKPVDEVTLPEFAPYPGPNSGPGPHLSGTDAAVVGDLVFVVASAPDALAGLQIFDIHAPHAPIRLGTLLIGPAYRVWVFGDYAYIATATFHMQGGYLFTDSASVVIADIRDPRHPLALGTLATPALASDVWAEGELAYLGGGMASPPPGRSWLYVADRHDPLHPALLRTIEQDGCFAAVGTIRVANGYAYIAAGGAGVQIVDVDPPHSAALVTSLGMPGEAARVRIVDGTAYVQSSRRICSATGDWYRLALVDVRDPVNPVVVDSYALADGFDVVDGMAYIPSRQAGLQIVDVHDPTHPMRLSTYVPDAPAGAVRVVSDTAYLATQRGLAIVDLRDKGHPVLAGFYSAGPLARVELSGQTAYTWGYTETLHILDVRNPSQPLELGSHTPPYQANYQILRWDLQIDGGIAYAYGELYRPLGRGLQIVDLRNPRSPHVVAEFADIRVDELATAGPWVYIAGEGRNMEEALLVLDMHDPGQPVLRSSYELAEAGRQTRTLIRGIGLAGDKVILLGEGQLRILDISEPARPVRQSILRMPLGYSPSGYDIAIEGDTAYVAAGVSGLQVWRLLSH